MASRKRSISDVAANTKNAPHKEWDEALCPICMDHPHNVVLVLCSSHEKGCKPYICDTSYRHSNCLDRFKKLKPDTTNTPTLPSSSSDNTKNTPTLKCPLCRGTVLGFKINQEARTYLNQKHRNCSCENCAFSGNYRDLRRHARRAHPSARPSNVDPSRQQAWRRLEHQREYNDIVSALRSNMPRAVVVGDYVVDDRDRDSLSGTYFLLEMIGSVGSGSNRPRPRARARAPSSRRRYVWGERMLNLPYEDEDDEDEDEDDEDDHVTNVMSDTGDDIAPVPRRRRRFTRSVSDDDEQS